MVKAKGQGSNIRINCFEDFKAFSHERYIAFNLETLHNKHGSSAKKISGGPQAMTVGAVRPPKCNDSLKGPRLIEPAWARKN